MNWQKRWFQGMILFLLAFIWGGSFILTKLALRSLSGGQVATVRMMAAGLVLLPLAIRHFKHKSLKDLFHLAMSGFLGGLIPALLYARGQTHIESALAGMLNTMTPVFTFIIGFLCFKMRATWWQGVGLFLGMAGALGLMAAGSTMSLKNVDFYAVLIVMATASYAANVNLVKARLTHLKGVEITSLSFFFITPVALVYFLTTDVHHITVSKTWMIDLSAVLFLGVVGTALAMVLMNSLIRYATAIFASTVTYIIPVFAMGWGLLYGERLTYLHLGCMLTILLGVYLINSTYSRSGTKRL